MTFSVGRSILAGLALAGSACAQLASQTTLVVMDDMGYRATHSQFFASLTARGHDLTYVSASDPELKLADFGEWQYDSLVMMAPSTEEFEGALDVSTVTSFIDAGHSAFIMGGKTNGNAVREIVSECGVEFDDEDTMVMDHSSFDASDGDYDGDHSLIVSDKFTSVSAITGASPAAVVYHGAALAVVDENELVVKVLTGGDSSYSYAPSETIENAPFATGDSLVLVAALQARNNARVVISGSVDMFSNDLFAKAGNAKFSQSISSWTFGHSGVIRAVNFHHSVAGGNVTQAVYTIGTEVTYGFDMQEWAEGKWVPYVAKDVQMEFVMIDPYVRVNMDVSVGGSYSKTFVLPDHYGVFQFVMEYNRPGVSSLLSAIEVPVRPLRHDEYERFIGSAFPYYVSALSVMVGFFVFSLLFLYADTTSKTE